MIPETRGRTSATRIGAIRPGSSRMIDRGCALTVMMLTSGAVAVRAEADASPGASHPASNGAKPSVAITPNSLITRFISPILSGLVRRTGLEMRKQSFSCSPPPRGHTK